jgi:hypothetical protein
VVVVLLDDVGFGASSAFGGHSKHPAKERAIGDRTVGGHRPVRVG